MKYACDWIYENRGNILHQIIHMHFDFTIPKSLKITPSDERKIIREKSNKKK